MNFFHAIRLYKALVNIEPPKSVVAVCLEGDTLLRLKTTVELFRKGLIHKVIVSGGVNRPKDNLLPAERMRRFLLDNGLPPHLIETEGKSQNTLEQAVQVSVMAREKGYSDLAIIASGYHLPRAYLTFLKQMLDNPSFHLYAFPAGSLSTWFRKPSKNEALRLRIFLSELSKIQKYQELGHVTLFEEAWNYLTELPK